VTSAARDALHRWAALCWLACVIATNVTDFDGNQLEIVNEGW